ncbi:uncharacterized protein LOC117921066 isoform X2 [Vitis riparia]|uniref:uncharacterized protein LOC117921066 isoform X2 n=1 Tax=Vitis riparia TaxID=96939 RepID=UPI00155A7D16|nr:uncharacterized protein LOC117921066 isoform X2 [Vitis riparia]
MSSLTLFKEQMFRRSCKSRALFFIPVFFLPATTRTNDKYVWQYELLGIRTCLGDKVGEFKNRCQSGVAGSILAISCCGGSLFIYPKFSSRSLYQRFMEEITGDDLQIEALPVGSIASDSAVTALLYWQGKLFVGCADRIIKVYSGQ